ncbi:GNAT family N-acetyltransferase [Mesorhizobium cantuariense]|uniref:GNAT family N-acetyltransferase n=1 Tax=Mesorhizobium cantuariense TaxID=1300275 RepID=A0ABV7MV82_9HYPH
MVEMTESPSAGIAAPNDEHHGCYLIRSLQGVEGGLCDTFFSRLRRSDLRWRFGGPRTSGACLLPCRNATLRGMAFAACSVSGDVLGILNLEYVDPSTAEIALIVRWDAKRRGIGRALISHVMRWSKAVGLKRLVGHAMPDNKAMLRLAIAVGFRRAGGDQALIELSWLTGAEA